jgi:hypothetical protein
LECPLGQNTVTATVEGPNDKVSSTIGTGFGDCGKISYSILNTNGGPLGLENFSFSVDENVGAVDTLNL